MKKFFSSRSRPPHGSPGVALVLVLCFIVLVTGLVVAFFSQTVTTRQLSNASSSTTQAEILASSAADVILGDLKTEIANGSIVAAPSPAPAPASGAAYAATTVYFPKAAAFAVPQRNPPPTPAPGSAPSTDPVPNLVRRSLYKDVLPAASPAPGPMVGSRASDARSDKPSLNGRYVSQARWNGHYLIPTATPAPNTTPAADPRIPAVDFRPDWVFVTAEKGPDVLTSPFKDSGSNAVTVTGRYAYAIYDEGGLLDSNQTGYPSASSISHVGAKPAPSYADLTQLPTPAANAAPISRTDVDHILGWRNYATLQATNAFPTLLPAAGSLADTAYYSLFAANMPAPTPAPGSTPFPGLQQVPLTLWNNRTDQRFLSRQQLIGFFTAASLDLRYLQYFGTFSRSLNQPSYLPEHSATSIDPSVTSDPATRRPVLTQNQGGNDSYGNTGINPNFLTARVINTFKRYDGTDAIAGEPLVRKRFPLNRLAWLTYKGPSSKRNTVATDLTGPDADIGYLKQNGITKEWLDEGTPDNILKYFGLVWNDADKWNYSHGTNGSNGAILNISNPAKPTDVARQTNPSREPDFFELLKGAINPGSIAKTSLAPSILTRSLSTTHAAQDQYNMDISLDRAILQIGANIIDQFDTDGFPALIHYDLTGAGGPVGALPFVCGDENVPYISRVRAGLLHLAEADPVETDVTATASSKPIIDTGVGALMNYPEIWNLHDWSASNIPQSMGAIAPKNFKIFARANDNEGLRQATTMMVWDYPSHHNSCDANAAKSPGFLSKYSFPFGVYGSSAGGEARYLSESNTRMTFSIDPASSLGAVLFREPTLLFEPNVPNNSHLISDTLVPTNVGAPNGLGALATNPAFFGSAATGGLVSRAGASAPAYVKVPALNATYIGFYIGAEPLRFWWDGNNPGVTGSSSPHYQTQYGPVNDVIYTLACEDGNGGFIPYDVKPVTTQGQPNANLYTQVDSGSGFNGTIDLDFGLRYYQTVDPRTSRFGMFDPWVERNTNSIPPRKNYDGSLSATSAALRTDREGANAGTAMYANYLGTDWFPNSMGWYPANVISGSDTFRPGLLTQNNPAANSDGLIVPSTTLMPPDVAGAPSGPFFYADADGVVRRAMGGNVDTAATGPATTATGLPMASAKGQSSPGTPPPQIDSRPSILNRPFRSVAELGYVYSGTPWKNLDFFQPESGDAALLDVFCVNDNSDSNAMTAGQVNLNTHQWPVLQAVLAQASKDQWNNDATSLTATNTILGPTSTPSGMQAQQLAQLLVTRTVTGPTSGPNSGNGPQPLQNVSDLVGRWVKPVSVSGTNVYDGKASCDGFAADLATFLDAGAGADLPMHNIQRFAESAVRALSNSGQIRVWNLMFDIVAQTGRYPAQATSLDQFNVEGEQHCWMHVAIDRYTGQVIDKQVEVVKE